MKTLLIRLAKSFVKAVFIFAVLLLVGVAALLYLLDRGAPDAWVRQVTDRLSSERFSLHIDRVTFSLRDGLHLIRPRVIFHPGEWRSEPFITADRADVALTLDFRRPWTERIREVRVAGLRFPGIPAEMRDLPPSEPSNPVFPDLKPFKLTLDDPLVMGIHAERVIAEADVDSHRLTARKILLFWPGSACPGGVEGWVSLDFNTRYVTTRIQGQALPAYIVPIMGPMVLDAPAVAAEMNAFQSVQPPVLAGADICVNIDTCDYSLFLDIDAKRCTYKGVPVEWLKGVLSAGDTNGFTTLTIGPLTSKCSVGELKGELCYRQEHGTLDFHADSSMDLPHFFDMIEVLNKGELDCIQCSRPPQLTGTGVVAVANENAYTNLIRGTVSFPQGTIFNLKVNNATADFTLRGQNARFDRVDGVTAHGGKIKGFLAFDFPDYDADRVSFGTTVNLEHVDLYDLASAVNVTNARVGEVTGEIVLDGQVNRHVIQTLNGHGSVTIENGVITQMPLFAGFTEYLAKNIPGISSLVNQSNGSMSFTIRNGILTTKDLLIEGDVFSISGGGSYDILQDKMDFTVRANIFKKKSLVGKITRLVTVPFTRLLLEFKVYGTLEKTDWSYVNIIEKITDIIPGKGE